MLLDTHALLWWLADSRKLRASWRTLLENPEHRVLVSAASIWEIAIKSSIGKLQVRLPAGVGIADLPAVSGFDELPIRAAHAAEVGSLPPHHGDPFDRVLIAQARVERLTMVSADPVMSRYGIPVVT